MALAAAWVCVPVVSSAQQPADGAAAQAEALIREGVKLRQEGKDERALASLQRAYDLLRSPRTEGQLGLVEMAVGYWVEAEQHLSEALESPEHPWVAKNQATLKAVLAQARLNIGEIALSGGPAGSAVFLNGRPAGRLPLAVPLRVPKGKAEIELRAPGYVAGVRMLRIAGNDRQTLSMSLERATPAPPTSPGDATAAVAAARSVPSSATPALSSSPPPPSPSPSAGAATEPTVATPAEGDASPRGLRRGLAWGTGAGALAALTIGVLETVVWQSKRSDFSDHRAPSSGGSAGDFDCFENAPNRGAAGCASLYDSAHTAEKLAIVSFAAGGALTVASVLLFRGPDAMHAASDHALACAPAWLVPSIACRLTY